MFNVIITYTFGRKQRANGIDRQTLDSMLADAAHQRGFLSACYQEVGRDK